MEMSVRQGPCQQYQATEINLGKKECVKRYYLSQQLTGKLENQLGKTLGAKGGPAAGKHGQSHTTGMAAMVLPGPC